MLDIGYMHNTPTGSSIVVVHIDDTVATTSNKAEMAKLKEELKKIFSLKDLSELNGYQALLSLVNVMHAPYLCVRLHILKAWPSDYTSRMCIW